MIWVSDLRILSLGLLCLWFGFAMHSFGCFVWHQRERERETFMLERRIGDSRNDVRLSPGGIVRHVDLEIRRFAGNISLYFAFATEAEAVDAVISLFQVGSSGSTSVFFALCCCCSSSAMWDLVVGF